MNSYEPHLLAFIDFLRFREAVASETRAEALLSLLRDIATFNGNFAYDHQKSPTGETNDIRAAISAFSDNIVISYPLRILRESAGLETSALMHLQRLSGFISSRAFDSQLLVRGAIVVGQLYHADSVVFGPALVQAYELERSAKYPRIIMDASVMQIERIQFIRKEDDGTFIMPYWVGFVQRPYGAGGRYNTMIKPWIAHVRSVVVEQIQALRNSGNERGLENWSWFNEKFEASMLEMPKEMLEMEVPSSP